MIDWVMPVEGEVISLSEVPDPVFSAGTMGAGFAIKPSKGQILSPVSGKITFFFPTKHAIGIKADNGLEILIHVGIDTVNLKGEGFTALVEAEQTVKVGQPLLSVDWSILTDKATSTITPVIFTDMVDGQKVEIKAGKPVITK